MNKPDKFVSMLGFAKRAGKIVYGFDSLKTSKRVKLLAVSSTASDNLKDGMKRLSEMRSIRLVTVLELEAIAGNNTKALGITDANMASEMMAYAESGDPHYTI